MAYTDDYVKTNWVNKPSTNTPLNQTNLNHAEQGIKNNCGRVANLSTTKAEQSDLLTVFKSVSFDSATGTFTFTRFNDTTITINTDLEKIAVNFDYDDNPNSPHYQNLIITLADGTVKYADLSALITQYEFTDTATIDITVSGTGTISASVIDGSITAAKLQPNYLADVTAQASIATNGANTATSQALVSEGWAKGTQNGTPVTSGSPYFENNAEWFKNQAQQIAGASLGGLSDVTINAPTNGQVLTYDADNNIWRNSDGGSVDTKSGNPLAITTDSAQVARSTTITLNPIQAAGTPTPANPLPISGYDNVTLSGGGNNLSIPLPETVYGGTYYAESGVLTVNSAMADMGDLNWSKNADGSFYANISEKKDGSNTLVCSCYEYEADQGFGGTNLHITDSTVATYEKTVFAKDNTYTDAAVFKTSVTGQKLVYELASPYNIYLNPQQVALLAGANTLTSNGTTITVIYREGKLASLVDVEVTNRQINRKIAPISINTEVGNPITFATDSVQTAVGTTSVVLEPIQASGTPTPSNPLAISGYNNIEVKVPWGANQWDEQWELGTYNTTTGEKATSNNNIRSKNAIILISGETYYIKLPSTMVCVRLYYDEDNNFISATSSQTTSFAIPKNAKYMRFYLSSDYGTTYNNDISINYPADVTAYSPFSLCTDINISLPNTVYGGKYIVETGVLTVTHGIVTLDGSSWTEGPDGNAQWLNVRRSVPSMTSNNNHDEISNLLPEDYANITGVAHFYVSWSVVAVFVSKSDYADVSAWSTALNNTPMQICYELASPYYIALTPQQVHLPSTKDDGGRVAWTNGTTIKMTYRRGEIASLWNIFAMGTTLNYVSKQAFEYPVSAHRISAGTMQGQVNANATAMANLGTAQVRNILITDTAPTVGSSTTIPDGTLIIVYE